MFNIVFAGNVGGDVTVREVTVRDEQVKVASFSVAVDNGQDKPPTWVRVSVWRNYADTVAKYVKKGDRVTISAESIKSNAWQGDDGQVRSTLEVTARRVDFSGNRRNTNDTAPVLDDSDDGIPF